MHGREHFLKRHIRNVCKFALNRAGGYVRGVFVRTSLQPNPLTARFSRLFILEYKHPSDTASPLYIKHSTIHHEQDKRTMLFHRGR